MVGVGRGVHAAEELLVDGGGAAAVHVEHERRLGLAVVAARDVHDHGALVAADRRRQGGRARRARTAAAARGARGRHAARARADAEKDGRKARGERALPANPRRRPPRCAHATACAAVRPSRPSLLCNRLHGGEAYPNRDRGVQPDRRRRRRSASAGSPSEAGVSTATVSRTLSGRGPVSEATRAARAARRRRTCSTSPAPRRGACARSAR